MRSMTLLLWSLMHPTRVSWLIAAGVLFCALALFTLGGLNLFLAGVLAVLLRLIARPEWLLKLSWRTRSARPMHRYRQARFTRIAETIGHEYTKMYEVNDDKVQAYAATTVVGSVVGISTGALKQCSDDELAVLYAHELGHLKLRHNYLRWALSAGAMLILLIFVIIATEGVEGLVPLPLTSGIDPIWKILAVIASAAVFPLLFATARLMEWQADDLAIAATGNKSALLRLLKTQQSYRLNDVEMAKRIARQAP